MAVPSGQIIDIEFVTDDDTESARLDWCARRRRAVIPGVLFLLVAELIVLVDVVVLWRNERGSIAFLAAMLLQVIAFTVAAIARDPDRPNPWPYPHVELITLTLLVASFVITFEHQSSPLSLVFMVLALSAIVVLAVTSWRAFGFLRTRVPDYGRAVHVRLDDDGLEVTVRPRPHARRIPWKSIRYLGSDGQSVFVVAGIEPVLIPRRALGGQAAWEAFVAATGERMEATLRSTARTPIWRHVRRPKTRRA